MLLSAVSVLVVAQSSSEIPEGLMNNPVLYKFDIIASCLDVCCVLTVHNILYKLDVIASCLDVCCVLTVHNILYKLDVIASCLDVCCLLTVHNVLYQKMCHLNFCCFKFCIAFAVVQETRTCNNTPFYS